VEGNKLHASPFFSSAKEEEYLTATANKANKEGENMAQNIFFAFCAFVVGFFINVVLVLTAY
jgi:hypothetical protein